MSKGDKHGHSTGAARPHGPKRSKRTPHHIHRPGNVFRAFGLGDDPPGPGAGDYGGVFRTIRVHTLLGKGKDKVQ